MCRSPRAAMGYSLVELLVVVTIIGVLFSLLLAGVQAARETARSAACRANLGQVAKALQLYEGRTQRGFPRRLATLAGQDRSWVVHTLPFLENRAAYDTFLAGANGEMHLRVLVCPSDPPTAQDGLGWLSYVANCGGVVTRTTEERLRANGVFHGKLGPKVPLDYINHHDGASYTALVSENIQAGRWTHTTRSLVGFVWYTGNAPDPNRPLSQYDPENSGSGGEESAESSVNVCSMNQAQIIDDGDSGYATTGAWLASSSSGFQSSFERAAASSGSSATWTFSGLAAGQYQVSVTWQSYSSCATNAAYTVHDGATSQTVHVDHTNTPQVDIVDQGGEFQSLGVPVKLVGDTLSVTLDASATNGYAIADAVRIECVAHPTEGGPEEPEARVLILRVNADKQFGGDADLSHARPSAYHVRGVNMAFCDGRVRFVSEAVDYRVYRQLMTPNGDGSDAVDAEGQLDPTLDILALDR